MNSSQIIQSPTLKGSKKLSIPQLNQLPFIPRNKVSNSPRAHRRRDFEANLLANKEAMLEKSKDTQSSQRVIKENLNASQVNKQMTISGLLKLREEKLTESQMFNGNRSVVFPKLKLATLKDKIIILKKKEKEADNQSEQKTALQSFSSSIRRIKSRSEIPQEFLEQNNHKSPRSPDLLEVLQDYMFQKKKNEIIDQEQESTMISQKFPMFSPRTSTQNLEQYKNSHHEVSLRHSFFVPQPSTTTKKRTPSLKISLNSQCLQEITSDEYGFDVKNESKTTKNKGYHKRGNSWSQNKEETYHCRVLNKEWTPAHYNNFVSENVHQQNVISSPSKQMANQDQGSLPNIYSIDSPRHFTHQLPSEMSKSKMDFNLKLNPVQKKNDIPSSETRKNVLPTTCSTGTKRDPKGKIS